MIGLICDIFRLLCVVQCCKLYTYFVLYTELLNSIIYVFNWLNIELKNLVSVNSKKNNLTFKNQLCNGNNSKWTTRYSGLL